MSTDHANAAPTVSATHRRGAAARTVRNWWGQQ
jgi:hypothetical protein